MADYPARVIVGDCGAVSSSAVAIGVASGILSSRVIEVLAKLVSVRGAPRHLRSDNGPEFVSRAILRWLHGTNIEIAAIDPGNPWQNGSNESFNGSLRDECLNIHWFESIEEAKARIEDWRRDYNDSRPHQALGQQTPFEYVMKMKDLDRSMSIETAGN